MLADFRRNYNYTSLVSHYDIVWFYSDIPYVNGSVDGFDFDSSLPTKRDDMSREYGKIDFAYLLQIPDTSVDDYTRNPFDFAGQRSQKSPSGNALPAVLYHQHISTARSIDDLCHTKIRFRKSAKDAGYFFYRHGAPNNLRLQSDRPNSR
jgi:hypothetical protein